MSRYLEPSDEVAGEMDRRSRVEAASWFADWLIRRDARSADLAVEQLAEALEALAKELRGEAREEPSARTRGLMMAATVLLDAAGGVRVGDALTTEEVPAAAPSTV